MFRTLASRRNLLAALAVFCLGLFVFAAAAQALAARRAWTFRPRAVSPTYRSPAPAGTPRPAIPPAAPGPDDPARPIPMPVPDPITIYQELLPEISSHGPDEDTVRKETVEIRRRLRTDPAFRIFPDEPDAELAVAAWNHEQTSEAAFLRALESLGSVEEGTTVAALRGAARALDARANSLEDAGAFERADELRDLARQLRQEARR